MLILFRSPIQDGEWWVGQGKTQRVLEPKVRSNMLSGVFSLNVQVGLLCYSWAYAKLLASLL